MNTYSKGDLIFTKGETAGKMYILQSGSIEIYIKNEKNEDRRIEKIEKPNEIFGIPETILKINHLTTASAIIDSTVNVIDLTGKNLKETIRQNPMLGLNFAINLSKSFQRRNGYLNDLLKLFKELEEAVNECCINYYNAVENFNVLNNKFRYPWLKQLYDKTKMSIIYNYGLSASKGQSIIESRPVTQNLLHDSSEELGAASAKQFKKGQEICVEGEIGNEMFILLEGELSVFVGGNKVAEIKEKGSIIGEIAVLLGYSTKKYEKRTATVKAKSDSKVVVIQGQNLEPVIKKDPNLIIHVVKTLSERLPETDNAIMNAENQFSKYLALVNNYGTTSGNCPVAFQKLIDEMIKLGRSNPEILEKPVRDVEGYLYESKQLYDLYNGNYQNLI